MWRLCWRETRRHCPTWTKRLGAAPAAPPAAAAAAAGPSSTPAQVGFVCLCFNLGRGHLQVVRQPGGGACSCCKWSCGRHGLCAGCDAMLLTLLSLLQCRAREPGLGVGLLLPQGQRVHVPAAG